MIARLKGPILEKQPHQVIVDVGGVGYRAFIPLSTYYALPDVGVEASLRIHTHLREDVISLYGFSTREEQELFERLIEISGIGPRLALAMLSGLPAGDLVDAISEGDAARLRGIPGVGPKTADRVVLEMRDRVRTLRGSDSPGREAAGGANGTVRLDVISALVNLGYHENQARTAVDKALGRVKKPAGAAGVPGLQELLRQSLKYLAT